MNQAMIWIQVYAVCRQAGDDHAAASSNANAAVEACKVFS